MNNSNYLKTPQNSKIRSDYYFKLIGSIYSLCFPYISHRSFSQKYKAKAECLKMFFYRTSIRFADNPAPIDEIEDFAFNDCKNLSSISFEKGSKLKKIGEFVFNKTKIQSIEFSSSVEEICKNAFNESLDLSLISYLDDSKL